MTTPSNVDRRTLLQSAGISLAGTGFSALGLGLLTPSPSEGAPQEPSKVQHFCVQSFELAVADGKSKQFSPPSRFTGHVYILPDAGDAQAVWLIGSDGRRNLAGGFKIRMDPKKKIPNMDIEYVEESTWRITGLEDTTKVVLLLVGISE